MMAKVGNDKDFRGLPSVDRVLGHDYLRPLHQSFSRETLLGLVRSQVEAARQQVAAGSATPSLEVIVENVLAQAQSLAQPSLRPVINATGVILHTNLGRSPLSPEALAAVKDVAQSYSNLEFDLASGRRGSRHDHLERLLCQLTGAEAALVVNNNAAAVLLGLSALARRKEVIVSRGQAVEIGGGFRIPDVMRQSGAKLVEVGTTNRTYLADYEAAIAPQTAALLRVHSSNFKVVGFTHAAAIEELVELGHRCGLLVLDDVGSGCLLDTTRFGLDAEPTVQSSMAAGVDLVFFSGDKLLGGPQAGIIVGKKTLIDRLKAHPLARAVRIDKLSIAALAATLLHYLKDEATAKIPVWRMIAAPLDELESRAQRWASALGATVIAGESTVGGGSLPGATLPTRLVSLKGRGLMELARRLRTGEPAVIGRIEQDALLLDPRTVLPEEDEALVAAVNRALIGKG